MMKYPVTRFVFARKKTIESKKLIQVEILLDKKKKYVSTGVKVLESQWNDRKHIVASTDSVSLNRKIEDIKFHIDEYISIVEHEGREFSWDEFNAFVDSNFKLNSTFADWVCARIESRGDIRESTKKTHRKLPVSLREFGKIKTFSDITKSNVRDYYEWMQNRTTPTGEQIRQQTVWSYMKFLRVYVRDAMARDLVHSDPFVGLKVPKGESEPNRWLSEEEVKLIENAELTGRLRKARDLFVLQCYTGLAFSDLMDFNREKLHNDGGDAYIVGKRIKTNEDYVILLLPKAKSILEKYDYVLPQISNQKYNDYLKDIARKCKINKKVASHWGRRTAGMIMLNNGVRIEVVSRVLGHASIKTTESCYASIMHKTVVSEMKKMLK